MKKVCLALELLKSNLEFSVDIVSLHTTHIALLCRELEGAVLLDRSGFYNGE